MTSSNSTMFLLSVPSPPPSHPGTTTAATKTITKGMFGESKTPTSREVRLKIPFLFINTWIPLFSSPFIPGRHCWRAMHSTHPTISPFELLLVSPFCLAAQQNTSSSVVHPLLTPHLSLSLFLSHHPQPTPASPPIFFSSVKYTHSSLAKLLILKPKKWPED